MRQKSKSRRKEVIPRLLMDRLPARARDDPDLMVLFTELVDRLYQRRNIFRIRVLGNAVPQVEHVAAAIAIAA